MSVKPILFSSLFILSAAAHADFNWQVDAAIGGSEIDYDSKVFKDTENDQIDVSGTYYIQTVNTENKPIREAAFMGRNSSVRIAYGTDNQSEPSSATDDDENMQVSADIRIGQSDFRVGGVIGSLKNDDGSSNDYSGTLVGVGFGWHIVENSLLGFELSSETGDSGSNTTEVSATAFTVNYKQIIGLGDTNLSVGGELSSIATTNDYVVGSDQTDDTVVFTVFAKWYMTDQFGFGGKVSSSSTDFDDKGTSDMDNNTMVAGLISYDFNELIGVSAEIGIGSGTTEYILGDDLDYDASYWSLAAQMRF